MVESVKAKSVGGSEIALEITTPGDIIDLLLQHKYPWRVGIYGRSGSGKSHMAGTFPIPEGKKLGVIDLDSGGMVYTAPHTELVTIGEDYVMSKPAEAYEKAMAALNYFTANDAIWGIVVDSFTRLAESAMHYIQKMAGHPGAQPTLPEYGSLKRRTVEFIYKAFGSNKHIICVFHEQMEKDELSGKVWCNPLVTGKLSQEIPMYFDEIYHADPTQAGAGIKYRVLTQSTQFYTAKSRLNGAIKGGIETYMPNDFKAIMDVVMKRAKDIKEGRV